MLVNAAASQALTVCPSPPPYPGMYIHPLQAVIVETMKKEKLHADLQAHKLDKESACATSPALQKITTGSSFCHVHKLTDKKKLGGRDVCGG